MKMTRSWTVLQHVAWEGPGLIAAEAQSRGQSVDIRRLDENAPVPAAEEVEGLVVMGGPMGVYDTAQFPFLAAECELIAEVVRLRRPILGVCLGAQLLAKALGARVFPGPRQEIGFGSVELTSPGKQDPVLGAVEPALPVFHWHGDTFDLPDGAVLLASSAVYAHQAFRYGRCAYGLQFHVEPDANTWAAWQERLPEGLIERSEQERSAIDRAGRDVLSRFFDLASNAGQL